MLAVDIINLIAYKFIYRYNCNQSLILLFIICIYRTVLIIFVCCENGAFPLHKDNKKIIFLRSILDIKIGQKAVIQRMMFFILAVVELDVFPHILNNAFRPKCRTKFSDYAGKPYSIGISANGQI